MKHIKKEILKFVDIRANNYFIKKIQADYHQKIQITKMNYQQVSYVQRAYIKSLRQQFALMTLVNKNKSITFRSPLANKIHHPLFSIITHREKKVAFRQYDQAFILRKVSKYCYHDTVIADFMPKAQVFAFGSDQKEIRQDDDNFNKLYATFNKDHKYYTPAFVVGKDLKDYVGTPIYDLEKFKQKLSQAQAKTAQNQKIKNQIFIAKPNSHKCQVCRCQYQDYAQHIKSQNHLKYYRGSLGWKYITQFVQQFQNKKAQNQSKLKIQKTKKIIKQKNKSNEIKRVMKIQQLVKQVSENHHQFKTQHISKRESPRTAKKSKTNKNIGTSSTHITLS